MLSCTARLWSTSRHGFSASNRRASQMLTQASSCNFKTYSSSAEPQRVNPSLIPEFRNEDTMETLRPDGSALTRASVIQSATSRTPAFQEDCAQMASELSYNTTAEERKSYRPRLQIQEYAANSFTINSVLVPASVLVFPTFALIWRVKSVEEISKDSLIAVSLLNPKPELVIVGIGAKKLSDVGRHQLHLHRGLQALGVGFDIMDTVSALTTFNVLNAENRNVCAALLPVGMGRKGGNF